MPLEEAIFLLLKLGLNLSDPKEGDVTLMASLSISSWKEIYEVSINQGVSAIMLDGINRIFEAGGNKAVNNQIPILWWQRFILEWTGLSLNIEAKNKQQERIMREMTNLWAVNGCRVVLMKGLANGLYYPNPIHRNPGDIDCYLFDDYEKGNQIAIEAGAHLNEEWYKHSEITYKGEIFENHHYFVTVRDGKCSEEMNKELRSFLLKEELNYYPLSKACIPTTQFNASFLSYHACGHFLYEGLRMKQLIDWAMFLHKEQNNVNWALFYDFCKRYSLKRFVDSVTAICVEKMGLVITNPAIATKSRFADKIVHSIFYDNDYVYSKGKGKWYNRLHVVKNMLRHRWKFVEIYEQGVFNMFWMEFKGFLFHTERGID